MNQESTKPRLLLHACCAPCATVPLDRLSNRYDISVFCYGPNIHPLEEYQIRLKDLRRLCSQKRVELIEGVYRPSEWGRSILPYRNLPEGSQRCRACYRLRMDKTAEEARERLFDYFSVTLTVSRHKDSKVLASIGQEIAEKRGVTYLAEDLKKKDGYNLSVKMSHQLKLRRQDYCGCSISLEDARRRRRKKTGI